MVGQPKPLSHTPLLSEQTEDDMSSLFDSDSHLFTLARRGKRLTPPLLLVVLVYAFYDGGFLVGIGGLTVLQQLPLLRSLFVSESVALLLLGQLLSQVIYAPIYLLLWMWLRWFEQRRFSTLGLELDGALRKHLLGMLAGLLMSGGWVALQAVTGHLVVEGALNFEPVGVVVFCGAIVGFYLARVFQIGIEELLFRGWVLQTIGTRRGTVVGVFVSSAFFALMHFWRPLALLGIGNLHDPWPPLLAFNILLWGIFTALWTLRDGSVWGPTGFHATILWSSVFVFGTSGTNSLLDVRVVDPSWLTGGTGFAGPVEGLPATALLLVGVMVMVWLSWRETEG